MEELCQPTLNGRGGPIALIAIQSMNFGLKNDMIQQVQNSCQFHGLSGDDANNHLDKFLHVNQSIKVNGVTDDALRLYLFPYSSTHHAIAWFDHFLRNSINTFEQMAKMFHGKYFPPSMVIKFRNEITNFHTFYNGLTLRHRDTINAAAGGTFMKRRSEECYDLIENMNAHHNDWDTSAQRSESSSSITSSSDSKIVALKAEMAKINKNLMKVLQINHQVKSVTPSCETCGGPHCYNDCPAIEKSHFMVKEGIVLGHKISKNGIEVYKAKVDVIAKLPHPTTVKGIHSFLGYASFYRRFIQDFSKISRPMTRLLEKGTSFFFSNECVEAFQTLKKKLTEAPILVAPDWDLPFELMCDASDFAIGAVLGQRKTNHFQLIHYASKTMTEAQAHYTTTKKELVAVVLSSCKNLISPSVIKKGAENLDADHLSRIKNPHQSVLDKKEINETFPLETLNVTVGDHQTIQLNELNELRDQAFENTLIYKEKTKRIHDSKIKDRVFNISARALLFNSRLKIFSGKLKTRWSGPFTITQVFPYGTVELSQTDGPNFKVNGHRLKHYFGKDIPKMVVSNLQTFPKDQ
nr:reverse transcriptase domain-containing protein [Tanacetum cinerariifolium]